MRSAFTVNSLTQVSLRALNYSPFTEAFRSRRGGQHSLRIGDLIPDQGIAYGYGFVRQDCSRLHGIELLSQSDTFSAEPTGRWIRPDTAARADNHRIRKWDIVTAGVGTLGETELYGRSIIADDRLAGRYVGDSLLMRSNDPSCDQHLYLSAFLNTDIGVTVLRATSSGTKQLRFLKTLLRETCIPDASSETKRRVADQVRHTFEQRGRFLAEIRAARQIIEDLPEVRAALSICEKRRSQATVITGPFITIGARNHAALGTARQELDRQWRTRLVEMIEPEGIFKGPRIPRVPCRAPFGIQFFDQRDVFGIRPIPRRIVKPDIPERGLFVPRHAFLVASRGQFSEGSLFGRLETAWFGLYRHGITEDILRVIPHEDSHDILYAYLSSKIGFHLLKAQLSERAFR